MSVQSAQPRWRRILWLVCSVVFFLNGLTHLFGETFGIRWLGVVFGVAFFVFAAVWLRYFLTTVTRHSGGERDS